MIVFLPFCTEVSGAEKERSDWLLQHHVTDLAASDWSRDRENVFFWLDPSEKKTWFCGRGRWVWSDFGGVSEPRDSTDFDWPWVGGLLRGHEELS